MLGLNSVNQPYLIWLWLDTAYNLTLARTQNGGDAEIGIISGMGAPAFENTITTMMIELPMFTYAS